MKLTHTEYSITPPSSRRNSIAVKKIACYSIKMSTYIL